MEHIIIKGDNNTQNVYLINGFNVLVMFKF